MEASTHVPTAPGAVSRRRAVAFRPFQRLPHLLLPCGARLQPPLRRDAVRRLLADDPDLVTWLSPGPGGTFTPQTLPEVAFRPLADWVDYVLDHDHAALEAWVGAARFDFLIVDTGGRALDAELIRNFPTGNGVEGGEFIAFYTVEP